METLYCHSANVAGKPRITVAGIVSDDTLRVGISRCSHKDVYIKKKGNVMAQGRAKSRGQSHLFHLNDGEVIPQFIAIANTIITQQGGVVKERKKKVVPESPLKVVHAEAPEELNALSKHN